ncbi:PSME3-interacting protein [Culicoides brevitarsis]|uniref:PSME3-interacting protein n=1 Tax=Culicoides brevitarsis TaxID=469753 RepID=UPI00307BDDF3
MSSGFVTESEIAEAKRIRQEEWEKVRSKEDPEEAPEPEIDHRSLFDRLQEQKQKKDLDYEETHKLKNMIRGLDDDEVQFLDLVDKNRLEAEKQQKLEEAKLLEEFRQQSTASSQVDLKEKLSAELNAAKNKPKPMAAPSRPSQKTILAGVVKKRSTSEANGNDEQAEKKLKTEENASTGLRCIGILPGIGNYKDTSDSEDSSDPETPTGYDLTGKKIEKKSCSGGE